MSHIALLPYIEGMLEGVWVVDPHTRHILSANSAAAALQQLSLNDVIGADALELSGALEDQFLWEDVARGQAPSQRSEVLLRCADGSTVHIERMITLVAVDGQPSVCLVAMQDKSRQHRAEQQLEYTLSELRAAMDSTADGLMVCDPQGGIRAFNRLFADIWRIPQNLLTHQDDAAIHAYMAQNVPDAAPYQERLSHIHRLPLLEATDVLVLRSGQVIERITRPQLSRGRPIGRVFAFRDITERTATENQLQLAAKVFESSPDAIFITDPQHRIQTFNPAASALLRKDLSNLVGTRATELLHHTHDTDAWRQDMQHALQREGFWAGDLWYRHSDGTSIALQTSWMLLRDAAGQAMHNVVFAKDLSEKLAAQQRIEQLAYSDALTGLANRLMLSQHVNHAIQLAERHQKSFAMLFLDLDRFKHINDSMGHMCGDAVLLEIARRLKGCLRQSDMLSRLGGDEFVIHLHDADTHVAQLTAQRIIDAINTPVQIDEMHFRLGCSVGIAMFPSDGRTLDELIQHADTAMYHVKERGKGHFRFYQSQMNADLLSRIRLDHAMREGLLKHEFVLHYQPRLDLSTGKSLGCEALVRWHHPEQGLVMPGTFIAVAEDTGFIATLGQWVLREAVRQAAQWASQGLHLQVAVNVSALQFQQSHFVDDVAQALAEFQLPADLLELELTESILLHDAEEALERLQKLARLGVEMSIDDFGTGYSSMSYLKRFPVHKLKIDRSFIVSLTERSKDAAIVEAIIKMGHALSLVVVAEGVELPEQRQLLESMRCDQLQGYLFSKPLAAEQLAQFWGEETPSL